MAAQGDWLLFAFAMQNSPEKYNQKHMCLCQWASKIADDTYFHGILLYNEPMKTLPEPSRHHIHWQCVSIKIRQEQTFTSEKGVIYNASPNTWILNLILRVFNRNQKANVEKKIER